MENETKPISTCSLSPAVSAGCDENYIAQQKTIRLFPALFSTPMVQSIEADKKTKTRRLVKGLALQWLAPDMFTPEYVADPANNLCPYGQPGDVIWVREKWKKNTRPTGWPYHFYSDDTVFTNKDNEKWKPSIHMPFKACKLFLQVKTVKIERLHDITEEDAIAEGVQSDYWEETKTTRWKDYFADASGYGDPAVDFPTVSTARESFESLWKKINGEASWEENPWVWVIEFEKIDLKVFTPDPATLFKQKKP